MLKVVFFCKNETFLYIIFLYILSSDAVRRFVIYYGTKFVTALRALVTAYFFIILTSSSKFNLTWLKSFNLFLSLFLNAMPASSIKEGF